jgi:hypothetical protein
LQDKIEEPVEFGGVDDAQHLGDGGQVHFALGVDDGLIEEGERIAQTSRPAAGDDLQSFGLIVDPLQVQDVLQVALDQPGRDLFEAEVLCA